MAANQKVVVITGASQGIGAALVTAYRDRGHFVVANSRNIQPSADEGVLAVAGDIGERAVAQRVIEQGIARFGRIDSLVNNAGIFIAKPFTQYTEADCAAMLAVGEGHFRAGAGLAGLAAARRREPVRGATSGRIDAACRARGGDRIAATAMAAGEKRGWTGCAALR